MRTITKALKLNPQDAELTTTEGLAYTKQGKYKKAIADYNKALKLNPQDAIAAYNRGKADAEGSLMDL